MKKTVLIYIYLIFLTFLSCSKNSKSNFSKAEKNTGAIIENDNQSKKQNDIYINKEFNAMAELNDVKALKFEETLIDSVWYGLYNINNSDAYIFTVDKILQNLDVAEYRIMDTVNLKSKNIEVKVEEFSHQKVLNLLVDQKLVKKWEFKTYPKDETDKGIKSENNAAALDENGKYKQLYKTANFNYLVKTISYTEEKKPGVLQIKTTSRTGQTQLINFKPEYVFSAPKDGISVFNDVHLNKKINKQNLPEFIVADVNFDGLEDFAIANYEGGNGGTLYAYFIQNNDKKFIIDPYLTNQARFFPRHIDFKNKTLTFLHISGCCSQVTFKIQLQNSNKWKQIFSEEKAI